MAGLSASARAAQAPAFGSLSSREPNASYLRGSRSVITDPTLQERLFDARISQSMRRQFEDMNRGYELRERYGLLSIEERSEHDKKMREFTRSAVFSYSRFHLQANLRRMRTVAENDPYLSSLRAPVAVAAFLASAYSGKEIKHQILGMDMVTVTNVPERKGHLEMRAPWLSSSFSYQGNHEKNLYDPTYGDERYRVELSRGLPIWDLQSGVAFGTTTGTVTTSLSKQLHPNLTAVVGSSRSARNERDNQETVKLFYGTQF